MRRNDIDVLSSLVAGPEVSLLKLAPFEGPQKEPAAYSHTQPVQITSLLSCQF